MSIYCGIYLIFIKKYDIIKEKWLFCRRIKQKITVRPHNYTPPYILGLRPRHIFYKKSTKNAKNTINLALFAAIF